MIAGLLEPDAGEVRVGGERVRGPSPERALIFQNYSLLPWLTVFGNIKLAVDEVHRAWTAADRRRHVEKFIAMVKLGRRRGTNFPANSRAGCASGWRWRVPSPIAPQVLLLDEPLSALDALTRATLQDEIVDIWHEQRTTVLWITNDPDEAILVADRVIPLNPGPRATLGPAIAIGLPRPRDREFDQPRREFHRTAESARRPSPQPEATGHSTVSRRLTLPDILPEDVMTRDSLRFLRRRRPLRRSEQKRETVEVVR